ncbi:MAG: FUSC family protein, partial [bacterium]
MGLCGWDYKINSNMYCSQSKEVTQTIKTDKSSPSEGKFITSFDDSSDQSKIFESKKSSNNETSSRSLDTAEKGKYAFIGGIGFGVIALLFIYVIPHSWQFIGMVILAMALLG